MAIIEISNVSKQFGRKGTKEKFYALKDVNITVEEGEIFSIIGQNGAGKTTLLNILIGILYPDTGSVKIFGKEPRDKSVIKQLSYVSGEERFHWALTTSDILNFGGTLYGLNKKDKEDKVNEVVKLFGLENIFRRRFDVLSTGERMRLAFAYSLINSPKLMLLDEPTLGLDPDIAIRIRKEIQRINKKLGTTILLTSHYMREVEQLAHRVAFMHKGEILDTGIISDIRKKYQNLEEYFVKMVHR